MRINRWDVGDYEEYAASTERLQVRPGQAIPGVRPFIFEGPEGPLPERQADFCPPVHFVPELRVDVFRNVLVAGPGFVFTEDGQGLFANSPPGSAPIAFRAPWTELDLSPVGAERYHSPVLDVVNDELDAAYLIARPSAGNYHHMLMDVVPRLRYLDLPEVTRFMGQVAGVEGLPLLANGKGGGGEVARKYLRFWRPDRSELRFLPDRGATKVKMLFVPHVLNDFRTWVSPELIQFYRGVEGRITPEQGGHELGDRFFHLRRDVPGDRRRIRNVDQLADALIARGFKEMIPAELTSLQQIKAFAGAKHIVGAMGSNLSNTVFCRCHAKVLCVQSLASPFALNVPVAAAIGHQIGYVFGPSYGDPALGEQVKFSINRDLFVRAIDAMLASSGRP